VDHRVEPSLWLTDGSDGDAPEGSESAEAAPADPPEDGGGPLADLPLPDSAVAGSNSAGTVGQDVPYPGEDIPYPAQQGLPDPAAEPFVQENPYSSAVAEEDPFRPAGQDTLAAGDGPEIPRYQPPPSQAPPYPSQVPPAPAPGVASKVTAQFSALTKPKARPRKPPRPAPATVRERVAAKTATAPRAGTPTRRAQLVLARIEPWSVMKFSFMVSLVGWVILFVAVAALYYVLSKLGVFHSIQSTITDVTSSKGSAGADANGAWFSASRILGYTMLVGAVNVVLITALSTVGAVVYNLVTHLAGGIEVTLKETD
jgi:hypothetical protein